MGTTKVCTKCGEELELICFYKQKTGKYGVNSECKVCRSYRNKYDRYRRKYFEIYLNGLKSYPGVYEKDPEKCIELSKKRAKNRMKDVIMSNEFNKRYRKLLSNSYVTHLLRNQDIPIFSETIEIKRNQLKIHRQIKQLKNETTEQQINVSHSCSNRARM